MNTTNTAVQVKKVSKTTQAWSIFRAVNNDATVPAELKRKTALDRFKSEAGITDKAAQTYYRICTDRAAGSDPHAGRKLANKARSVLLKGQPVDQVEEVVAEVVEQPTVDLSNRWLVGSDRNNLTGSFKSRAEAQQFAKDNSIKWFDATK
jgi:hypothetical protein